MEISVLLVSCSLKGQKCTYFCITCLCNGDVVDTWHSHRRTTDLLPSQLLSFSSPSLSYSPSHSIILPPTHLLPRHSPEHWVWPSLHSSSSSHVSASSSWPMRCVVGWSWALTTARCIHTKACVILFEPPPSIPTHSSPISTRSCIPCWPAWMAMTFILTLCLCRLRRRRCTWLECSSSLLS